MAGFTVPPETSILVAELDGVGKQHPLSMEKLSPVLALYWVKDFAAGMNICESLLRFGGLGHTCVIYSTDDARIREYAQRMPANRVLVNTPAPQGSTGITTNVFPSMTLGCGAAAGNITSDNVGPQHLYNIKRLAYAVRTAAEAFETPAQPAAQKPLAADIVDRFLARRSRRARGTACPQRPRRRHLLARPRQRRAAPARPQTPAAAQTADRGLRLRGRRTQRHQAITENLYRAKTIVTPVGPRFGLHPLIF